MTLRETGSSSLFVSCHSNPLRHSKELVFLDFPTYAFFVFLPLVAITAYGMVVSRRSAGKSAAEYFLGSRTLGGGSIGCSLFVTHLLGFWLLGNIAGEGINLVLMALAVVFAMVLGFSFGPLYWKSRVTTLPEFLSRRFNNRVGAVLSGASVLFSVGVRIPLMLAFALWVMSDFLGWSIMASAGLIVVVVSVGLYTIMGGLQAVVRTHVVETAVVLAGLAVVALGLVLQHDAMPQTSGVSWTLTTSPIMFAGLVVIFAWQWWIDQFTIQRVLAAASTGNLRWGVLLYGLLTVAVMVLVVTGVSPLAIPFHEQTVLKDIFGAIVLTLLMATLASEFHSAATLVTNDLLKNLYAVATDESSVLVGRLATTLIVVLAILQVSTLSLVDGERLALLQQAQLHVVPPMAAVVLLGIFWRRMNSVGAVWALIVGEAAGVFDLAVRYLVGLREILGGMLYELGSMNVSSFGLISFGLTTVVLVVASLATDSPPEEASMYLSLLRKKGVDSRLQ